MSIKLKQSFPSYSQYRQSVLATFVPGKAEHAFSIPTVLKPVLRLFSDFFSRLAEETGSEIGDFVRALLSKDLYRVLLKVQFSVKKLFEFVQKATDLIRKGILTVFEELEKRGYLEKLRQGGNVLDEILDKYPIIKKLAGPAIAGILLYIWLNMSFIGNVSYDFNIGTMLDALTGRFSLTDLFLSPSGLTMLTFLATGMTTGIGVSWLGSSMYNLCVALIYTGAVKLKEMGIAKQLKAIIKGKENTKAEFASGFVRIGKKLYQQILSVDKLAPGRFRVKTRWRGTWIVEGGKKMGGSSRDWFMDPDPVAKDTDMNSMKVRGIVDALDLLENM